MGSGLVNVTDVKTSTYVASYQDYVQANSTAMTLSVFLPMASGATGQSVTVKKISTGANSILVVRTQAPGSVETIDGSTLPYPVVGAWTSVVVVSNGLAWLAHPPL